MKEIALVLIALYLFVAGGMFFMQRSYMYFPDRQNPGDPASFNLRMQVVKVRTSDGLELSGWFAPPSEEGKPVVILFHGNAGNIALRAGKTRAFLDRGYGYLLAEYRGYGGNPGTPTEDGLYADGRAWIESVKPYPFVLWGESLGSGIATRMATEFTPLAIVLEAPFTRTADVGQLVYPYLPVSLLIRDRYDSIARIKKINAPLLIVHGEFDNVVPVSLGRKLFENAAEPKEFVILPGAGHNNLFDFGIVEVTDAFLRKILATGTIPLRP